MSEAGSARRTFGRDVVSLSTVRLASAGAGFLTSVLSAQILGASALGVAGVGLTTGSIAALIANGGLNISGIYFLGQRPDQRDPIVAVTFTLGLVAAALGAVLVVVGAPIVASRVVGDDLPVLAATALVAASIVSYEVTGSLLLGLGLRGPYVLVQVIEGIGSLVAAVILLILVSATAAGLILSSAAAFLGAAVVAGVVLGRSIRRSLVGFDGPFARESLALGLRGQVGNVLQFLNLRLDVLFIPIFIDLRAAGIYIIAVRMSEVVSQVSSATGVLLFPEVSRSDVRDTAITERAMRATIVVVGGAGLAIAIAAEPLLTTFFGTEFGAGTGALRITMLAMVPLAFTRLLAGDLKGRGRPGLVSLAAGSALIATVVLDVALIPRFGIEGAALASLCAYGVGSVVIGLAYRRITGASLRAFVPRPADLRWLIDRGRGLVSRRG